MRFRQNQSSGEPCHAEVDCLASLQLSSTFGCKHGPQTKNILAVGMLSSKKQLGSEKRLSFKNWRFLGSISEADLTQHRILHVLNSLRVCHHILQHGVVWYHGHSMFDYLLAYWLTSYCVLEWLPWYLLQNWCQPDRHLAPPKSDPATYEPDSRSCRPRWKASADPWKVCQLRCLGVCDVYLFGSKLWIAMSMGQPPPKCWLAPNATSCVPLHFHDRWKVDRAVWNATPCQR